MSEVVEPTGDVGVDREVFNARVVAKVIEQIRALGDEEMLVMYNQAIAFRQQQVQSLGIIGQNAQQTVAKELLAEKKASEEADETEEDASEE